MEDCQQGLSRGAAMKLAFLGLGAMGSPMAAALLADGMDLTVWNRDPTRTLAFKASGTPKTGSAKHRPAHAVALLRRS
jgi:3-hydroxyisobutyrate dehydrogenase-like beta-hydroxyacid dehydrogenase